MVDYNNSNIYLSFSQNIGGEQEESGSSIIVDNIGNIYVTGSTFGSLGATNAGVCTTQTGCPSDIFLIKWNSSGVKQWTKQWGTTASDSGNSVAVDSLGNVFVVGSKLLKYDTDGNIIWVKSILGNSIKIDNNDNLYILLNNSSLSKYTNNGDLLWTKSIVSSNSFALDNAGNIYITGSTTIGLDGNTNAGGSDVFLIKFEAQ